MKAVIVNPHAGGGRAKVQVARLLRKARIGAPLPVVQPDSLHAMREEVRRLVGGGCERLVVAGGDGTVHLVANELLALGAGHAVTLGLLPAGTGCDLARTLRIPASPEEALQVALEAPPRAMDAGRIEAGDRRFFFVNVASAGISGLVDELVNANPRRGALAFLASTLRAVRRYRAPDVTVEVDGAALFSGPVLVVAVANGKSFGKGMKIAPSAAVDDGVFDVVVVRAVRGWELLRRLPLVYLGRHLHLPQVRFVRGHTVRLEFGAGFPPFDVDGECYPSAPATVTVLAGALRVASRR